MEPKYERQIGWGVMAQNSLYRWIWKGVHERKRDANDEILSTFVGIKGLKLWDSERAAVLRKLKRRFNLRVIRVEVIEATND